MGERLQIGEWRLDTATAEMSRGHEVVRLEARTLKLLLFLASRSGEVIGINELLDHVWADVTVSQDSVYQAVASLRRSFGDDPKNPSYIITVPRQGYRLVASVSTIKEPSAVPATRTGIFSARNIMLAAGMALCFVIVAAMPQRLAPPAPISMNSVAVIPFLDLTSAAMDDEYVADGVTEELIDQLSSIPHVRVPAPTASFHFKGKRVTVGEFARALNVAFVVDGSLRRSGGTFRIAVRFIRGSSGLVLWSETFDRPAGDILKIQDEIAARVAKRLRPCFLVHARPA